jgi:DNA-directed RNA polymerase subunit RPC12/RpoP
MTHDPDTNITMSPTAEETTILGERVMSEIPEDTYSDDGPVCPYCQHLHRPDDSGYYVNGGFDCASCGKEFEMTVDVVHWWDCRAKEA